MDTAMTFEEPIGDSECIGNPAWNNISSKIHFLLLIKK
jgi:hypothetical protein